MPSEMDSGHQDPHPPGTTISVTPYTAPFPPRSITPPPPKQTLVTLHNRKKEDPTVTESITITIHERVTFTEKEFLTRTDTVYINQTIFIHDTVTHTSTKPILTLNPTP
ncbi:MAG: hypothetical protein L6R42_001201, partial [Xanthoria sp. 1 TBL-2021]